MLKSLRAPLFGAALAVGLSLAGGAQAANVTACFGADVANVVLSSSISGMESAVVVLDAQSNAVIKADNYYNNGAGTYWTSALPQTTTLKAGCYTFYFMAKPGTPVGTINWICANPSVWPGDSYTVIGGSLGNVSSAFVLIPAVPTSGQNNPTAACPRGW